MSSRLAVPLPSEAPSQPKPPEGWASLRECVRKLGLLGPAGTCVSSSASERTCREEPLPAPVPGKGVVLPELRVVCSLSILCWDLRGQLDEPRVCVCVGGGISAAVGERGGAGQTSCSWGSWRQEAEMKPRDPNEQSEVWGSVTHGLADMERINEQR